MSEWTRAPLNLSVLLEVAMVSVINMKEDWKKKTPFPLMLVTQYNIATSNHAHSDTVTKFFLS